MKFELFLDIPEPLKKRRENGHKKCAKMKDLTELEKKIEKNAENLKIFKKEVRRRYRRK